MPVITLDTWLSSEGTQKRLVMLNEAAKKIHSILGLDITSINIAYLIQYGKIKKYKLEGRIYVDIDEVENYYRKKVFNKKELWERKIGKKLDWELSFEWVPERERTKHVHRLHPYKGKFIPQLVEYFLTEYFKQGDIVIDPFMGSGTTLVQAMEMGIHSIGIDISPFNCLIAEAKLQEYEINKTRTLLISLLKETLDYITREGNKEKDKKIDALISEYNSKYFSADYRKKIVAGTIEEREYSSMIMENFFAEYDKLDHEKIENEEIIANKPFLSKWYSPRVRRELLFYKENVDKLNDEKTKKLSMIVLSRTARSCRATTHSDLATLKEPVFKPYYCFKHKKICKPVTSIAGHIKRYTYDVIKRIEKFSKLRKKETYYSILWSDSRYIDVEKELRKNESMFEVYSRDKIAGLFTSPPYLGQIDYHEQHAYAYELLDLNRFDDLEIGPKFMGQSKNAQQKYIDGISDVFINMKKYMSKNAQIFVVVNDKRNVYPDIFEKSELELIREYRRPVLNRTSRDRNPYYESIFMVKRR